MSFKAMPHFMAQGHMAGDWACHYGAFGFEDVPNGAGHRGCDVRLLPSKAFGLCAKLRHIFSHFPMDAHLIHDAVVVGHGVEGQKLHAGHGMS